MNSKETFILTTSGGKKILCGNPDKLLYDSAYYPGALVWDIKNGKAKLVAYVPNRPLQNN